MAEQTRYQVRLSVPRVGGWRAWGAVSGEFERRLAEQDSPAITARVDSWVRRGRDYLQVVIVATVDTGDVAEALDMAWWVFRKATGDDAEGWDLAEAAADKIRKAIGTELGEVLAAVQRAVDPAVTIARAQVATAHGSAGTVRVVSEDYATAVEGLTIR